MDSAHRTGVIHRDPKPANVLLLEDGTPKIADFGLAKMLDGAAGQTQSGAVMRTPSYLAPEQASGTSKERDRACDILAPGTIRHEQGDGTGTREKLVAALADHGGSFRTQGCRCLHHSGRA